MTVQLSPSKWNLMVPFITSPELPIEEEQLLNLDSIHAKLQPLSFGYSSLLVEDLESPEAAHEVFGSLRIGLLAMSLNLSCGMRVRSKVEILAEDSPMPNRVGVPIIYPDGKDLSRLLVSHLSVRLQVGKVMPTVLQSLAFGMESDSARQATEDDRVSLALELYSDSYFETSDSARFLGLVNVLEVLKDTNDSSDAACALIDRWTAEAGQQLDSDEAKSIMGSLGYMRQISISRGIGSAVCRHLGNERVKEAQRLYTTRSGLVHDGIRLDGTFDALTTAQRLVTELLAHILQSGSLKLCMLIRPYWFLRKMHDADGLSQWMR